jgi:putative tryptophan/tyrosine transport system substrate-binding protein
MRRREFIAGLGGMTAAWPPTARAEQTAIPVLGYLNASTPELNAGSVAALRRGLNQAGFIEGRNLTIEYRWAEGHLDRRPALAADLVQRQVSVIVATGTVFAAFAKAATQTIPIVFIAGGDPVEFGLSASFNRPTGNLTGVHAFSAETATKRLQLLHEMVPSAETIAMLAGSSSQFGQAETKDLQRAAEILGVRLLILSSQTLSEIEAAFATAVKQQAGALLISAGTLFFTARSQIISLANIHAIPTMFSEGASVVAGGLSSYGADFADMIYQAGLYAGRILKGEKPGDLPVLQQNKFEFVINLKNAKTLGLTIPPTVLAISDRVIE